MPEKGYVDIHTHIIPGVDDGSKNIEESVRMLEIAYNQGIRTIYATPHYGSGKERYDRDYLTGQYELLKEKALGIGDGGIELLLGNEIYYRNGTIDELKSGQALTMNNTKYVLVEFNVDIAYKDLYSALQKLVLAGYRPILAHIERYFCLMKKFDLLYAIKNLGVCMQINASSVIPKINSEASFCRKAIREGYISFLGSDCHRTEWRPPCMADAVRVLTKKTPEKIIDRILYKNPVKLYNNEFI
ncbi:MAG: histidinol-phosphatase [Lachnospiraceae bacterium]|nr:histidinol-phosphatase [Lachnospiraceae bacterium]